MTRIALVVSCLVVLIVSTFATADFPRRGRSCSSPCFTPSYTPYHETAYVAPVVASTITLVEVPTFVFSNLGNYPSIPEVFRTPQQTYQPPIQAQPPQIGLSDKDVDRIANVVVQRLQGAASVAQNTMILGPPAIQEDSQQQAPPVMSQNVVNSAGFSCAQCHQQGKAAKGGLTLFNESNQFSALKNGMPYATPERIWQRAESLEMPPSAQTDPSKRLSPEAIAYFKAAYPAAQ